MYIPIAYDFYQQDNVVSMHEARGIKSADDSKKQALPCCAMSSRMS